MNEALIEQATTAFRARDVFGRIQAASAWHDLTAAEREVAFARTIHDRAIEAALDPEGLSSTGRAVLARILAGG